MDAYAHCMEVVRAGDSDRYIADLHAPPDARRHLLALHAFDVEVARIADIVSEPLPGEIRLQWWRDALRDKSGGGNPVADALIETMSRFALPRAAFDRLLEARTFDLYNDPIPTLADLEAYAGNTVSATMQLAAIILAGGLDPGAADAAGHGGVAISLTGILRAVPYQAARRKWFLPADMAKAAGVELDDVFTGRTTPALTSLLAGMNSIIRQHLAAARASIRGLAPDLIPAFLPLALVEPYLRSMERPGFDPLRMSVQIAPLRRQWLLWRAGKRGLP